MLQYALLAPLGHVPNMCGRKYSAGAIDPELADA
jgi:hypothetical protein